MVREKLADFQDNLNTQVILLVLYPIIKRSSVCEKDGIPPSPLRAGVFVLKAD